MICLPKTSFFNLCLFLMSCDIMLHSGVNGGNYSDVTSLLRDKLEPTHYDTDVIPLIDQSQQLKILVDFSLVGIVDIDDITQRFILNGFFKMCWKDELMQWDPQEHGGVDVINVKPSRFWRPRMWLINTVDDYDPFEDLYSSTSILSDGTALWIPGGVFTTSCQLNMRQYPFDFQSCSLLMCPIHYRKERLIFEPQNKSIGTAFFVQNKGWTLEGSHLTVIDKMLDGKNGITSCLHLEFDIKRRSTFFILNIILPVLILSLLNNLVFLIPIDSGERISYAITVLLSISVMMGTVSTMVPQASDVVPTVTIYIFALLLQSCVSVISSIWLEYLHKQEVDSQEENRDKKVDSNGQQETELHNLNDSLDSVTGGNGSASDLKTCKRLERKWVMCTKRLPAAVVNKICFVSIMVIWVIANVCYFGDVL